MSEQYLGQIRILGSSFAPHGFLLCNGTQLPMQQYAALYSLLGTQFGGDGRTNFLIPDMRGRTMIGCGTYGTKVYYVGQNANCGQESVTLTTAQVPAHTHTLNGSNQPGTVGANGNVISGSREVASRELLYGVASSGTQAVLANSVSIYGQGGSHTNMQPYLTLNFSMCTNGYYPTRP
jgi:microcystin-dependent protein